MHLHLSFRSKSVVPLKFLVEIPGLVHQLLNSVAVIDGILLIENIPGHFFPLFFVCD